MHCLWVFNHLLCVSEVPSLPTRYRKINWLLRGKVDKTIFLCTKVQNLLTLSSAVAFFIKMWNKKPCQHFMAAAFAQGISSKESESHTDFLQTNVTRFFLPSPCASPVCGNKNKTKNKPTVSSWIHLMLAPVTSSFEQRKLDNSVG